MSDSPKEEKRRVGFSVEEEGEDATTNTTTTTNEPATTSSEPIVTTEGTTAASSSSTSAPTVEDEDKSEGQLVEVKKDGEGDDGDEDVAHQRLLRPLLHRRPLPEGKTEHDNAERDANFLSKAFLFFVYPILSIAGEKDDKMSIDDIDLPTGEDSSARSFGNFEALWDEAVADCKQKPKKTDDDGNEIPEVPNVNRILLKLTRVNIALAAFAGLFTAAAPFANPILMRYINEFVASAFTPDPEPLWKGGIYCAIFFVVAAIGAIAEAQMQRFAQHAGLQVGSALQLMMVKKSMTLSGLAQKKIGGSGALVQHFSTDIQTCMGAFPMVYGQIYSLLFSCIGAFIYLFIVISWPGVVVLVVLCIVLPINYNISTSFIQFFIAKMQAGDARTNKVIEVLNSIRVIKFYAWEKAFREQIAKLRAPELDAVYNLMGQFAKFYASFSLGSPTMQILLFAVILYARGEDELDAVKFFQAINVINILNMTMLMGPMIYSEYLQLLAAEGRLGTVFLGDERDPVKYMVHEDVETGAVQIKDAEFAWAPELPPPMPELPPGIELPPEMMAIFTAPPKPGKTLNDINFLANKGDLVMVVGKVGAGKSSLVNAILSEMTIEKGTLHRKGSIAYVPQTAWILNATVRNNIIVNRPYDPELYMECLEAVDLTQDLKTLSNGDLTEVGEKGINLSGGQKQRVSLARALYQQADIYIFDDPLSALDAHVGRHVFDEAINGVVADKTRILITNQMNYVVEATRVYVADNMTITEETIPEGELPPAPESEEDKAKESPLIQLLRAWNATSTAGEASPSGATPGGQVRKKGNRTPKVKSDDEALGKDSDKGKLHAKEERHSGSVKNITLFRYLGSFGGPLFWIPAILMQLLIVGCEQFSQLWMAFWQSLKYPEFHTRYPLSFYLGIFAAALVVAAIFTIIFQLIWRVGAVNAPRQMYDRMTGAVLKAPMVFFDTTPVGRIVNRFTEDAAEVDISLAMITSSTITLTFKFIASAASVCYAVPWSTPVFVVACIALFFIQPSVATVILKRLASSSSSPVFNLYQEVLNGALCIRGMRIVDFCTSRFELYIDERNGCHFTNQIAFEAVKVRVSIVMAFVASLTMLVIILTRDQLDPTTVVFGINNISQVAIFLGIVLMQRGQLLMALNAVERIVDYTHLEPEPEGQKEVPADWPSKGEIEFKNVHARYRKELDLVLKGVNFTIAGGQKVGVVGRTGSGKSSLLLSVFRIIPIETGSVIEIDGIDTATIPLETLRSRVAAIPQEPILFAGTVQTNLDPTENPDKEKLRQALEMCHLVPHLKKIAERQQAEADAKEMMAMGGAGGGGGDGAGAPPAGEEDGKAAASNDAGDQEMKEKEPAATVDDASPAASNEPIASSDAEKPTEEASNEPVAATTTTDGAAAEKKEGEEEANDAAAAADAASPTKPKKEMDLLDIKLADGDLSVGQRQLLCLARAVSRGAKILVLDEATSSVDVHTDALIQKTIRTVFKDCTVITVAHRLNTIMDSDRIVVLDQGSVAEHGTPQMLLANENSIFSGLCADANDQENASPH